MSLLTTGYILWSSDGRKRVIVPLVTFGNAPKENTVLACSACNHEKSDMTGVEYLQYKNRDVNIHQMMNHNPSTDDFDNTSPDEQNYNKENYKKRTIPTNRFAVGSDDNTILKNKQIAEVIDAFKEVNPSHKKLFAMKPQRDASSRLIEQFGYDKMLKMVAFLKHSNQKSYAP